MITPERTEYGCGSLERTDLDPIPLRQFRLWFDVAVAAGVREPDAMALATASATGRPSCRMVLLRGVDERGLCFFSNYQSRKGLELSANPFAAITFFWRELERQVRIEGRVERTSSEESDAYFASRPANSRLGAWASPQSEVVRDRSSLDEALAELAAKHSATIPRPPHWGGYRLIPESYEFWQGRPNRLHDRFLYRRRSKPAGAWLIERLAP
jgi:pyridoxamine 5'-phosphate oxidase